MRRLLLSAALLLFTAHSAIAADTELVSKWYSTLKTKAEYIESLDNWKGVTENLTLIMKGVNSTGETTVCYKFSENSF